MTLEASGFSGRRSLLLIGDEKRYHRGLRSTLLGGHGLGVGPSACGRLLEYSNGANIAASLILLHPHYLKAAVLFRAMVPFTPDMVRNFSDLSVFLAGGIRDPIVPRDQTEQLAAILESGGADVVRFWHRGGHELGEDDIQAAKKWLEDKISNGLAA